MLYVSKESREDTDARLRHVIRESKLTVYPGAYAFVEIEPEDFPNTAKGDALAFVRDDDLWCQLVPCDDSERELFAVFRFEFPKGADNSGFVGWLASMIKEEFGTGVFVICGQNNTKAGIYDYWGYPASLRDPVLETLKRLQSI